jgi:hypothetical protein
LRPDRVSPMSRARDDSRPVLVAGALGGSSEDMMRRELLRLLSMIGVLLTMPSAEEQLDQLDYLSTTSGQFDNLNYRRLCGIERTSMARIRAVEVQGCRTSTCARSA